MMNSACRGALQAGVTSFVLASASATAQAGMACEGLTAETLGLAGVTIVASEAVAASDETPTAHCLVSATTGERTGIDGKPYAIRFEMRLPDAWNGRFFHQFNGGNDGVVRPAVGPFLSGNKTRTALGAGYAVLSSDAGHDGEAQPEAGLSGSNRFGLDPEARAYYGYKAVEVLTPIAKGLITAYYGSAPERSYGAGCSNGGRHALVAAARLPDAYDGLLAGAPGFNLPRAAVQHALDVQAFKAVNGDVRKAFAPEDLAFVAEGIRQACDGLDGAEDGMVLDTQACQATFDLASLQCKEGQNSQCLAPAQVEALATVHAGPKNSQGEQLYSDWSWDTGIASGNWRFWKLESPIPPWGHMPLIAVMGAGSLAQVFTTPPTPAEGNPAALEAFLLDFDFDEDAHRIYATDGSFAESAMDVMSPPGSDDPTLAEFKEAGGKLIVFHGVGDPVFSFNDTRNWYEKLDANQGGAAGEFAKLYPVPGMAHCSAGAATDDFDLFTKLVDWVEKGEEPREIVAGIAEDNKDIPADWSRERTRPLCPYPQVAHYRGGDPESAESFACEQ